MKQKKNQQIIAQEKELLRKYELLDTEYLEYLELMVNTKFQLKEIKEQKSYLTQQLLIVRKKFLEKR